MGHFVELVLELIFEHATDNPEEMPEMDYKDSFTVRYYRRRTLVSFFLMLIWEGVFILLCVLIKDDTRGLFVVFACIGAILLVLSVYELSFKCYVDDTKISSSKWWLFKKKVSWQDVLCVRILEKSKEKTVAIALYSTSKRCMIDFNTDMENAWYIVKMAERKGIDVQKTRDLPLSKMGRL